MAVTGGFVATGALNPAGSVYLFDDIAIGTAASDRIVVSAITYEQNATISGVTVNGVAADEIGQIFQGTALGVGLFKASVTTGTTADIEVTMSANSNALGISTYAIYGADYAETDYDETSAAGGASITLSTVTVPTDGIGIWVFCNASAIAVAWTNANEDVDTSTGLAHQHSCASTTTAGTPSVTADGATATQAIAGVAFGPAAAGGGAILIGGKLVGGGLLMGGRLVNAPAFAAPRLAA